MANDETNAHRDLSAIHLVVLHHAAANELTTTLDDLKAERQRRNEGYNIIVRDVDGKVVFEQDAPDDVFSNGVFGLNHESWNLCCDGNFEIETPRPELVDTVVQVLAVKLKLFGWKKADVVRIVSHQEAGLHLSEEHYYTACPGQHMIALIPSIRERVAAYLPA